MIKKLKYIIPCILLLLVSIFYTKPASAVEIVQDVIMLANQNTPYFEPNLTFLNGTCGGNNQYITGGVCQLTRASIRVADWNMQPGQLIQVQFLLTNYANDNSSDHQVGAVSATAILTNGTSVDLPVYANNFSQATSSSGAWSIYLTIPGNIQIRYINLGGQPYFAAIQPNEVFSIQSVSAWAVRTTSPTPDPSGAINQTAAETHRIQELQLQETVNLKGAIQEQSQDIKQQVQQDKEQYEQEKSEEQQREQEMDDASQEASNLFNFSVRNPLEPIFNAFTAGNCVSIPNLARMVGSEETTYCSWFSSSTRSILTPVISIFSIIILFGFVVKWLNKDDGGGE